MKPRYALPVLVSTGLAVSGVCSSATAQTVAEFYRGKTITVIAPIGPGGTYDFAARLGALIMQKHLPGNPRAVTQLMTGAGGAVAAAYVANAAPKDGTALLSMHGSSPQNQVLGITGDQYDLRKFLMIGQIAAQNSSLTVWRATSPALTIEEVKQKEVVIGSTGVGSYQYQLPTLLNALLGTKFKVVLGWKSVGEQNIAMERGEIHARGGTMSSWAITQPHWVKENKIAHLVQVGLKRARGFEDVPLAQELTDNPDYKKALLLIGSAANVGRSIVGSPGIPPDRAKALREAFDKGVKDPEIIAQAQAWKLDFEPESGVELEKIVNEILDTPKPVVEMVKKMLDIKPKDGKGKKG